MESLIAQQSATIESLISQLEPLLGTFAQRLGIDPAQTDLFTPTPSPTTAHPTVDPTAAPSASPVEVSRHGASEWTTVGQHSWVVPAGVTSVSVVAVGGGGGGAYYGNENSGGAGGGLGWRNTVTVVPGSVM